MTQEQKWLAYVCELRANHEAEMKIIADQAKFWEDAHAHLEEKLRTQYDAERDKERNETIDECIECLNQQQYALFDRKELESLKKITCS